MNRTPASAHFQPLFTSLRAWVAAAAVACNQSPAHDTAIPAPDTNARHTHERLLTLDTHLDTPISLASPGWDIMRRHDLETDPSQVDYPRMVKGGLDGGFWAIYTPQGPRTPEGEALARDAALVRALRIHEMVATNRRYFEIALRADDAPAIATRGKRIVYLSIENGYPLGHDLSLLQTFYSLGVRMFGFVHFLDNDLGDSSTDPKGEEWRGLSPLGKQVVTEANRLGIVLDASHASDDVLDQLIELSKTPIILSHSGCKAVFDHPRNVDDDRLRRLAASGGVIQINSLSEYLIPTPDDPERRKALQELFASVGHLADLNAAGRAKFLEERRAIDRAHPVPKATFDDFMKHLLHALALLGPDHVGIGADWDGGGGVTGMEDVASIPKITERLVAAGYTETDLTKIWGGNVLRLLRTAEGAAKSPAPRPEPARSAR
ncbi:MAG: dipeptidase [Polyangiaceae bacterium]